jgi:hypothetical protein
MRQKPTRFQPGQWDRYLEVLRTFPFVEGVAIHDGTTQPERTWPDAILDLKAGGRAHRLLVEWKAIPRLNRVAVETLRALRHRNPDEQYILFAPHITPQMGALLAAEGINYADAAGNGHLLLGNQLLVHVEGKRPAVLPPAGRGLGAPGYRVLFAVLVRPELLNQTVREIAVHAGVVKTTVAEVLRRFEGEGALVRTGRGRQIIRRQELVDRWLIGYADVLRPVLMTGRYQIAEEPPELERRVETDFADHAPPGLAWAWGGGAAAYRLTGHYRGEQTILHVNAPIDATLSRLRAVRARDGNLTVLGVPGPLAFAGAVPGTVHPLLVHAELLALHEERADEAARELRNRLELTDR